MFGQTEAFSGIGVDDLDRAREFYERTLGLGVERLDPEMPLLSLKIQGSRDVLIYEAPGHRPASSTVLNFPVDDVDAAVDELGRRGVELERYEHMDQDEKGVMRGPGPQIAWFKDPAGNVLSVLQES